MLEYACRQGMLEEETITEKDLFDTKIMGILTPHPSVVRRQFWDKYNISPKAATDFYYQFSQATNHIRNSPFSQIMHDIHAQSILHRKLKGCSYNF